MRRAAFPGRSWHSFGATAQVAQLFTASVSNASVCLFAENPSKTEVYPKNDGNPSSLQRFFGSASLSHKGLQHPASSYPERLLRQKVSHAPIMRWLESYRAPQLDTTCSTQNYVRAQSLVSSCWLQEGMFSWKHACAIIHTTCTCIHACIQTDRPLDIHLLLYMYMFRAQKTLISERLL